MSIKSIQEWPSPGSVIDQHNELLASFKNAYRKYLKDSSSLRRKLLLKLSKNCIEFANALFMSFYDVNTIIISFLQLWICNCEVFWVEKHQLLLRFSIEYGGFINEFFSSSRIYLDDYFQFVCIFLYFKTNHLIHLLMSMSGILSNLFVFKNQLNNFINVFSFDEDLIYELEFLINKNQILSVSKESISVKTFVSFCKSNLLFNSHIFGFRSELIRMVCSIKDYSNIKKRMDIHYNNQQPPNEKCCNKMIRLLFTHKPSPYHHDFHSFKPKEDDLFQLINKIRTRFGYSKRIVRSPMSLYSI